LFRYLKWLHPCGKPQGIRRLEIKQQTMSYIITSYLITRKKSS